MYFRVEDVLGQGRGEAESGMMVEIGSDEEEKLTKQGVSPRTLARQRIVNVLEGSVEGKPVCVSVQSCETL
jgi:hypothetical protein